MHGIANLRRALSTNKPIKPSILKRLTRSTLAAGMILAAFHAGPPTAAAPANAQETTGAAEREIVVVVFKHFPPQYQLDRNGTPTGFAVDTMEAIAARAGLRLKYVIKETGTEVLDELYSGRADVMPNVGIAAGREKTLAFTAPLETFRVSLFIRDDTLGIASLDDLAGKEVGVVEANLGQKIMANRTDAEVTVYPDYPEALFALLAGTVDAFIYPEAVIWQAAREARVDNRIRTAGPPLREVKRAMAVRKDNTALLATLAPAVDEFLRTEEYRQIYTRWYGKPAPFWSIRRVIWVLSGLLLLSALVLFIWRQRSLSTLNRRLRTALVDLEYSGRALRISEERRSLFMDSATEHFVLYDADLNLIDMNAVTCSHLGWKKEDVIGKNLVDLFPEALDSGRYEKYLGVLETGEPIELDIPADLRDQKSGHFVMRVFRAGTGIGISSADYTERRQAEAALRESEARLNAFFSEAPAALVMLDSDLRYVKVNDTLAKIHGRSPQDHVGKTIREVSPDFADDMEPLFRRVLDTGESILDFEAEGVVPNEPDVVRSWVGSLFPILGADGKPTGIGAIATDVTERKRVEKALHQSDERLRTVVDHAPILLWAVDSERVNTVLMGKGLHALNIDPKERLGRRHGQPRFATPETEKHLDAALKGEDQTYSLSVEGRDFETRLVPLRNSNGAVEGAIGVSVDVTDRNRAERDLAALNQRLEELVVERTEELRAAQDELINAERLAALGHVTATVAHELRNPLGTIRNSFFGLRSKLAGRIEGMDAPLQRIERNILRCDRIIGDLLDYSRSQDLQLEAVDLNECLAAWLDDYELSEGMEIGRSFAHAGTTVDADLDRMHQVLVNILDNAWQALGESRGAADRKIAVRTRSEGGHFVLEVADNGPGISDDVLPRIFEPLFSTKGFGVGLGLPLVKKIVEQHEGAVEVRSGAGEGTTFCITLPLASAREAAA